MVESGVKHHKSKPQTHNMVSEKYLIEVFKTDSL
jgi:hypothetical protein